MSNSSLISYTRMSPNHSGRRNHTIDTITPHCVVGQLSVESLGGVFANSSRQASSNYGIGYDGRVALYVDERNRSWCSSSASNDNRAVTIECASDLSEPYYMNDKVINSLIELCVDICQRNGKDTLLWFGNRSQTLNYTPKSNEMVFTVHRWFANKSCPGGYLYNRLGEIAKTVTNKLGGNYTPSAPQQTNDNSGLSVYEVAKEVIQGKWGNGEDRKNRLERSGYNYTEVQREVNNILGKGNSVGTSNNSTNKNVTTIAKEVIQGKWGNGEDRKRRLQNSGYNYNEVQNEVNRLLGKGGSNSNTSNNAQNGSNLTQIAKEVIQGKYGNGDARKRNLEARGYNYNQVQAEVNRLLGKGGSSTNSSTNSSRKSIDTIAREVIQGKYGNGATRQKNIEALGYNYREVQNRVNQLLR